VVITYGIFGTTYRSHLEGSRIQEEEKEEDIVHVTVGGGGYKNPFFFWGLSPGRQVNIHSAY